MNLSTTKRELTEKQQNFLANLIETKGDLKLSAELAGYSSNHYQIINSLRQEIVDLASTVLAREAPKAAFKTERLDIHQNVNGGIFILPAKETIELKREEDYEEIDQ